jgi:hypothetical protein
MNWLYIIGGAGAFLTLLGLLYNIFIGRKNATIETLTEKNKWLAEQLKLAKANSGDILVERLHERGEHLKAELTQLSKDYEANKALIADKERELEENREMWVEVGKELGRMAGDYQELKAKVDLCPYCEAKLVELKDVTEEDWTGSHRKYECGFTQLDSDTVFLCPHDPAYPKFDQLKLVTEYDEKRKRWTCRIAPISRDVWRLPDNVTYGTTEREAKYVMQLQHEGRLEEESESEEVPF